MSTAMMAAHSLSQGDEKILSSVFDPENSPDTPTASIDPSLPPDLHIHDPTTLKQLRGKELQAVRSVEEWSIFSTSKPAISLSGIGSQTSEEAGETEKHATFLQALQILSSLIDEHKNYASAYNNRAQLYRWRYGNTLLLESAPDTSAALDKVFDDLNTAISLATPAGIDTSVSPAQAKLLSQAWMQRGAVLWSLSKTGTSPENRINSGAAAQVAEWRRWDKMKLEEEGSRSFFMAGMYGSEIGRNMAVKTNPYARLCAGIVKEAMRSEYAV